MGGRRSCAAAHQNAGSPTSWQAMGCPGDVAESVLGHMIPGVAGAYNRHQYDAERVEWLRRLSERLEELARP